MMSGRDEGDPELTRGMGRLLRDFAAHVGIDAECGSLLDVALAAAGTPSDSLDPLATRAISVARRPKRSETLRGERNRRAPGLKRPDHKSPRPPATGSASTHPSRSQGRRCCRPADARRAADDTRSGWQPALNNCLARRPFMPTRQGGLALPEPPVVDQNRVRTPCARSLDQGSARRHAADQPLIERSPFDLQAIRHVVVEITRGEKTIAVGNQCVSIDHGLESVAESRATLGQTRRRPMSRLRRRSSP
jgi:hypothetical protein